MLLELRCLPAAHAWRVFRFANCAHENDYKVTEKKSNNFAAVTDNEMLFGTVW